MKYPAITLVGLLLTSLSGLAHAANIAYVAKIGPGTTGAGKQWPTIRFVSDSTGNCITDNLTGLMWAKNANLFGTGTWGSSTTAGTAQYMVAQMNTNSSATGYQLCGHSDWRLPNISELRSLINYASPSSVDWLNNNAQGFTNVQVSSYWSSTAYDGSDAWPLSFNEGFGSNHDSTSNTFYVWPVRGGK